MAQLDKLDQQLVCKLVDWARSQGLPLTGEDGLLVYPVAFIDAIHVKIRDGHVANQA